MADNIAGRDATNVTVIAPEVRGYEPLAWLSELGGVSRIAGVNLKLIGGPACTREVVAQAFECPQQHMIWSGHGMPGGLAVPDDRGGVDIIPPKWLATQVKCAAPRLFVLATCNSLTRDDLNRSLAEAISFKGVNAIGYNVRTQDPAAVQFNVELIRMLARGADIGDAFGVALEAIEGPYPETAQGVFLLPGLTNGLGEIRQRLDRLEEAVFEIRAAVMNGNGTGPKRLNKTLGC